MIDVLTKLCTKMRKFVFGKFFLFVVTMLLAKFLRLLESLWLDAVASSSYSSIQYFSPFCPYPPTKSVPSKLRCCVHSCFQNRKFTIWANTTNAVVTTSFNWCLRPVVTIFMVCSVGVCSKNLQIPNICKMKANFNMPKRRMSEKGCKVDVKRISYPQDYRFFIL